MTFRSETALVNVHSKALQANVNTAVRMIEDADLAMVSAEARKITYPISDGVKRPALHFFSIIVGSASPADLDKIAQLLQQIAKIAPAPFAMQNVVDNTLFCYGPNPSDMRDEITRLPNQTMVNAREVSRLDSEKRAAEREALSRVTPGPHMVVEFHQPTPPAVRKAEALAAPAPVAAATAKL